jgi:hypothetical protein
MGEVPLYLHRWMLPSDQGSPEKRARNVVIGDLPRVNPGANRESIFHRCYPREVAFEWGLTKETICWPLGCLWGWVDLGEVE